MTVGVTQARAHRRRAPWRAPRPATPRRRSPRTRRRRNCRRWCSCPAAGSPWGSWRSRWPTGRAHCWCAATSTIACGWWSRPTGNSASTCSTRSTRSGSRGRRRSCSSCCCSWAGSPPDWIVVPAGNLGNTAAFGKALREARALGLISRVPRIAAVQAAGAAPFATAFAEDFAVRRRVRAETVATAIKIGDPASWDRAVRAIRETNGVVLAVSDAEILEAKAVIDASGVGCEPASAASVAGVQAPRRRGNHRARRAGGGDPHGSCAQGPGHAAALSPGDGTSTGAGQPAGGDRCGLEGGGAGPAERLNGISSSRRPPSSARHPGWSSS